MLATVGRIRIKRVSKMASAALKIFTLCILFALSKGKVLKIVNNNPSVLAVNVGGAEHTVASNSLVAVVVADDFSDSITAVPANAEVTDGPRTKIELSLGAVDTYVVSLVDGFNLGAKIIPTGSVACSPSLCAASINSLCPVENQVANSLGTVVACKNSPAVMSSVCPLALVNEGDVTKTQSCVTATSYMVHFN
ncbi:uncharacterized protein LOC132702593 [Cylas formicarius]|uniref:uncharacterized protein LOC132702593 n=1 Tax=Cylas formicarius TaxID=197179 RepID=UPI002958426A|nr:uncharacterized protein LOC132702593 [Cylas formicarius]